MSDDRGPGSTTRRPLALLLATICLLAGILGASIQGWRMASGALTYEGGVVPVIGSLMVATMGAMALGVLLRRR